MKEITTILEIPADVLTVWDVLIDFSSYPDWNPFIRRISGCPEIGETLEVEMTMDGKKTYMFHPVVVESVPGKRFSWMGRIGFPGLFDGVHSFDLEPVDENMTRLTHGEQFSGFLTSLVLNLAGKKIQGGFHAMNRALQERVSVAIIQV